MASVIPGRSNMSVNCSVRSLHCIKGHNTVSWALSENLHLYKAGLLLPASTCFIYAMMGQTSRNSTSVVLFFASLSYSVKSCILFTINII